MANPLYYDINTAHADVRPADIFVIDTSVGNF
jgi:hypothetical protein